MDTKRSFHAQYADHCKTCSEDKEIADPMLGKQGLDSAVPYVLSFSKNPKLTKIMPDLRFWGQF